MKIIKLHLPLEALPVVSNNPAFIAEQLISMWIVKIMIVGDLEKLTVTGWVDTLYGIARRQVTSNSSFVVSHLEAIRNQLAQGKAVKDVEIYLQQLKELY